MPHPISRLPRLARDYQTVTKLVRSDDDRRILEEVSELRDLAMLILTPSGLTSVGTNLSLHLLRTPVRRFRLDCELGSEPALC